jgi:membrane-associated phospholipid phosphatase
MDTLATPNKMRHMTAVWRWFLRRDGLFQILIVVGLFEVYEILRHFMVPNWTLARANGERIEALERWGHFAWEQSLQSVFLEIPDIVKAMNLFYFVGHFILTGVFFTWLYFRSRDGFRSFRNGFIVATAIALFIHWKFPTAPPRLMGNGIEDTLRALSNIDIGSQATQSYSNPVAAVPSLHAGWAVGVMIGVLRYSRRRPIKVLAVVYPIAVLLTIVVTGNHFIFDAVAGILVMAIGFLVSFRVFEPRRERQELAPAQVSCRP